MITRTRLLVLEAEKPAEEPAEPKPVDPNSIKIPKLPPDEIPRKEKPVKKRTRAQRVKDMLAGRKDRHERIVELIKDSNLDLGRTTLKSYGSMSR